jgi:hypothetical protein
MAVHVGMGIRGLVYHGLGPALAMVKLTILAGKIIILLPLLPVIFAAILASIRPGLHRCLRDEEWRPGAAKPSDEARRDGNDMIWYGARTFRGCPDTRILLGGWWRRACVGTGGRCYLCKESES